jgi:hypothetical protein
MSKITDGSYPFATNLDEDDIALVVQDGTVRRATPATLRTWVGQNVLNVKNYGAVGDGVADDSSAFAAALDVAKSSSVSFPGVFGDSIHRGQIKIVVPAGVYRIVQPEAMLSPTSTRIAGLVFEGAGLSVSNIFFDPAAPGAEVFLCSNTDGGGGWMNMTFKDLTFQADDNNASFMYSESDGGPQYVKFQNVEWNGRWKRGVVLEGTNNNSEMTWNECSIAGFWQVFFDIAPDDQVGGDLFVCYDFYAPRVWIDSGTFIKATRGGSINVYGASIMLMGDGTADVIFADLAGVANYVGPTRFQLNGARVEQLHDRAKIIRCTWPHGNVLITNCDFSPHLFTTTLASHISAEFNPSDNMGAIVSWRDCFLHGRHRYMYSSETFQHSQLVTYDGCTFQDEVPNCFLIDQPDGSTGGNLGGRPQIDIRNSRMFPGRNPIDQRFGWQGQVGGAPQVRYCQLINPYGTLPMAGGFESTPVELPLNAIITGLHGWKPASGSSGHVAFTYTFENGDGLTLGVIQGDGTTPWSAGFESHVRNIWFPCTTTNTRTISVVTASIDQVQPGVLMIEYLA